MAQLITFLTFNDQAEAAANHYVSIFDGKIAGVMPGPAGSVMGVNFEILGKKLIALNGGPSFAFSAGISLFVEVDTQEEVDRYWTRLTENGGKEVQCGWLVDKFGVSWQIVPKLLGQLLGDRNRDKAGRAMQAMLKMKKLDIASLQRAFEGA